MGKKIKDIVPISFGMFMHNDLHECEIYSHTELCIEEIHFSSILLKKVRRKRFFFQKNRDLFEERKFLEREYYFLDFKTFKKFARSPEKIPKDWKISENGYPKIIFALHDFLKSPDGKIYGVKGYYRNNMFHISKVYMKQKLSRNEYIAVMRK